MTRRRELLANELREVLPPEDVPSVEEMEELGDELSDEVLDRAEDRYEKFEETVGEENMRKVENWLLLESIDFHWREHLTAIDDLRTSIGLQAMPRSTRSWPSRRKATTCTPSCRRTSASRWRGRCSRCA